jgi:hypothetical protein
MWKDLQGKEYNNIEDFEGAYGFIYKITHKETGKFYIGKKQLIFKRKKKLGKKELAGIEIKPGRRPTSKLVESESDWLTYWGSSKELCEVLKKQGHDKFERVIIQLAYTSKLLTYYEAMYQMKYDVLQIDSYNHNILGKIHRKDFL